MEFVIRELEINNIPDTKNVGWVPLRSAHPTFPGILFLGKSLTALIANHKLPVTNHQSQITSHKSQITNYQISG
ncbi:Uncharacterized protein dnm_063780 [Desulfonema magnum]|uniref:Uncharacterized protein n=1 Tax=Desulfonema magnum TaxID=45655 RepID=A0A975BRX1_9BACT|nr:Uncharacterized protein dnm_063780 [Desulfonema magnum]